MKSLALVADGLGNAKLEALALPFGLFGKTATDRDRARKAPAELAQECTEMWTSRHGDGEQGVVSVTGTRHLVFVVTGAVEVATSYMTAIVEPGDVLLVDDPAAVGANLRYRGDCRLLHVAMSDAWQPAGTVAPVLVGDGREDPGAVLIRNMYVEDGQARFRDFDALFPASGETTRRPVAKASFTTLSPDAFGDWHTEVPNNLVVVLGGGFELEVGGGGGAVEVFRAGDVCLVEDHEGQGHITRTRGETRFAAFAIPDDHLWAHS